MTKKALDNGRGGVPLEEVPPRLGIEDSSDWRRIMQEAEVNFGL